MRLDQADKKPDGAGLFRVPLKSKYWTASVVSLAVIGVIALILVLLERGIYASTVTLILLPLALGIAILTSAKKAPIATPIILAGFGVLSMLLSVGNRPVYSLHYLGVSGGLYGLLLVLPSLLNIAIAILLIMTINGKLKTKSLATYATLASLALVVVFTLFAPSEVQSTVWNYVILFIQQLAILFFILALSNSPNEKYYIPPAPTILEYSAEKISHSKSKDGMKHLTHIPPELLDVKSIGLCIFLSIITFGIYSLVWMYSMIKKIQIITGEPLKAGVTLLLCMFVPFYSLFWIFTRGKKLYESATDLGVRVSDNSTIYLVLCIFGLSIVTYALIQNDLNTVAKTLYANRKK
jgi:uncharacterized membrane protein